MPAAGGGFEQCSNAQAAVAVGSLLAVVSQAQNDKQQLAPALGKIAALPEELGKPENLLADSGYFSAANVEAGAKAGIDPMIAMGRQPHHPPLAARFATAPHAPENPTPVDAMAHRLKTLAEAGRSPRGVNRPRNRCSASSNQGSDSVNFRGAAAMAHVASGVW